jgi:hypothetical protein
VGIKTYGHTIPVVERVEDTLSGRAEKELLAAGMVE